MNFTDHKLIIESATLSSGIKYALQTLFSSKFYMRDYPLYIPTLNLNAPVLV